MPTASVAIPVLNGGPLLADVLDAVAAQRVDRPVEVVVIDSGSTDDSISSPAATAPASRRSRRPTSTTAARATR